METSWVRWVQSVNGKFVGQMIPVRKWKVCWSDESSPWTESLWVRWVQSVNGKFVGQMSPVRERKVCGSDESSPWMESLWVRWVQSILPHSIYLQAISNLFSFLSPTPRRIPSWEAPSLSANQETPLPLLNPRIHCHLNNSLTNARLQNVTTVFKYRLYSSTVGIATRYGLDGPAIESQWGEIFRTHPDRPWGTHSLWRPGRGLDHPPPI